MKQTKERRQSGKGSALKKDPPKDDKVTDDGAISLLRRLGNQNQIRSKNSLTGNEDDNIELRSSSINSPHDDTEDMASHVSASGTDLPDWYEDLTDDHTSAFKELFDMLDSSKTGLLNADSLFEGLQRVDNEITKEEVENVLKKLDKDGNGEIDFDEFLFHMTQGEDGDSDKKKGRNFSKRQRLFYTAITEFSLKTTLGDIERSYLARMRQAPHVLSHYTAGVRLIGLTDRQLQRQMQKMQKTARNNDSPYAKPLPFVSQSCTLKPTRIRRHVGRKEISEYKLAEDLKLSKNTPVPANKPVVTTSKVLAYTQSNTQPQIVVNTISSDHVINTDARVTLNESLKLWDKRGSVVSKLPGSHLIASLRAKIRTKLVRLDETKEESEESDTDLSTTKEESEPESEPEPIVVPPPDPENPTDELGDQGCNWRITSIPKIEKQNVPLPALKIKYLKHRPTIDDLPNIREKATQAIRDYYQSMRRATVQNASAHWDKLYADTIRPKKLLENFRTVYRAYSPHKEEEAFVVCPWIPGPYRHFRHHSGRHYGGGLSPDLTNKRPYSVH